MVARKYKSTYDAAIAVQQDKVAIAFVSWSDPIYDDGDDGQELIGENPYALISGKAAHMRQLFPDGHRYTSDELEYVEGRPWRLDEVSAFLSRNGYEVEV